MAEYLKSVGNLKVYMRKDSEDTAVFFAKDISRKLKEFRDIEHRDVLFLSSGGSALSVLDRIDVDAIGPYLTIGIFDERFDPTNKTSIVSQKSGRSDITRTAICLKLAFSIIFPHGAACRG